MQAGWWQWIAVAVGGAIGSMLRWRVGLWLSRPDQPFPYGTLAVNCAGGLLIGAAIVVFQRLPVDVWRLAIVTGMMGGLTTFSSFSAESLGLLHRGQWAMAVLHSALHLAGALVCAAIGHALVNRAWPAT